ncbi:hypothetical protein D3C83_124600 [compost metagenome]
MMNKQTKALTKSNLSAIGSSSAPKRVCWLNFLAIKPSTASEIAAIKKIPKATVLRY